MENIMNFPLFHNGSILVSIGSLRWSVFNTDKCTGMMNENAHESFNLKFEINVKVWVNSENWGVFFTSRGWPQALLVCCDRT